MGWRDKEVYGYEQGLRKNTPPRIQAYATVAAMKRMGINPRAYTGGSALRWMKVHPAEVKQEIVKMNRNRPMDFRVWNILKFFVIGMAIGHILYRVSY